MGVGKVKPIEDKVKPIEEKQQTKTLPWYEVYINKKSLHQEKLYTYKPVNPAKIIKQS